MEFVVEFELLMWLGLIVVVVEVLKVSHLVLQSGYLD